MDEKLYLGVARQIITPPLGTQLCGYAGSPPAERVADDLTATAFYFQQGQTKALMVSLTVCSVKNELAAEILGRIEKKTGLPPQCVMLCATHTHTGPLTPGEQFLTSISSGRGYVDSIYIPRILAAVEEAIASIQPVQMGIATGESLVGINRRELRPDNKIDFGQNPWGPFDPRMTVLSFRNDAGKTVANMIHYAAHCTAAGCRADISRDWPGIMIDTLDAVSGGISAFFNGPEGDIGPRLTNGMTSGDMSHVQELGCIAAQDAVKIYRQIFDYHDVTLKTSSKALMIPVKKRPSLEEAKTRFREYENKKTVVVEHMKKTTLEKILASYESGYEDLEAESVPQNLIALGNVVFAGFPYEPFAEIGLRIDRCFPQTRILSLSNTNGSYAYFITEDAIPRGGYEVQMFLHSKIQPYVNNADWHLVTETVKHIQSMEV